MNVETYNNPPEEKENFCRYCGEPCQGNYCGRECEKADWKENCED